MNLLCMVLVAAIALPDAVPKIRRDHPRLFFNAETWPAVEALSRSTAKEYRQRLIERCDGYPDDPVCSGTEPAPPNWPSARPLKGIRDWGREACECALAWRFTNNAKYLAKSKRMIEVSAAAYDEATRNLRAVDWYANNRIHCICAYDWIYEALTPQERRALMLPLLKHASEVQPDRKGKDIVRSNGGGPTSGMYGEPPLLWYTGVAAANDGIDDKLAADNLAEGYRLMKEMVEFRVKAAADDGPLSTGCLGYASGAYPWAHFNFFHSLKSATGVDACEAYPELGLFPNYIWWVWIRTDDKPLHFGFGDERHATNHLNIDGLYEHFTQYATSFEKANPDVSRLALALRGQMQEKKLDNNWVFYPYILKTPDLKTAWPQKKLESKAIKARHFETTGQFFMRSAWAPGATYATFTAGGTLTGHRHFDENNFVIYHRGFQALDSGSRAAQNDYNLEYYYSQTVAHNCILVHQPNVPHPYYWGMRCKYPEGELCDGGQTKIAGAKLLAFETNPLYTYIASDAAPAYPDGVRECVRQFVHIGDDIFVVYDRVSAAKPTWGKEWLLHTEEEPAIDGTVVSAQAEGGVLFCRTLLPAKAKIEKVGGEGKEFWSNGRNWEIDADYLRGIERHVALYRTGPWFGRWRFSVSPTVPAVSDRFFHIINVGDAGEAKPIPAEYIKEISHDVVEFEVPNLKIKGSPRRVKVRIAFNNEGGVGGEIRYQLVDSSGKGVGKEFRRVFTTQIQKQSGVIL